MGRGDTFALYSYGADNGANYQVKLSTAVATAGGFGSAILPNANPKWPWLHKQMRYVTIVSSAGKRDRLPIGSAASSLYQTGGTVTLSGTSYTVEGMFGERRPSPL